MFPLIFTIVLIACIIWLSPVLFRRRSPSKNDLKVYTFNDRYKFSRTLNSSSRSLRFRYDIGNVYVEKTPSGNGRFVGSLIIINKHFLKRNKSLIANNIVSRDHVLRRQVVTPGRDLVVNDKVVVDGRKVSLWHVTHMLPFRYCLSDGQIPGLMFMGTAHLNSGSRPDAGYFVPRTGLDSVQERVNYLHNLLYKTRHKKKGLVLDYPELKSVSSRYGFTQFSMDDFERLSDYVINSNPNNLYKYGVMFLRK